MKFIKWLFSKWSHLWIPFVFSILLIVLVNIFINPDVLFTAPIVVIIAGFIIVLGGLSLSTYAVINDYKNNQ